jgi:hypothetical protein
MMASMGQQPVFVDLQDTPMFKQTVRAVVQWRRATCTPWWMHCQGRASQRHAAALCAELNHRLVK